MSILNKVFPVDFDEDVDLFRVGTIDGGVLRCCARCWVTWHDVDPNCWNCHKPGTTKPIQQMEKLVEKIYR